MPPKNSFNSGSNASTNTGGAKSAMTQDDASRIQGGQARSGGDMSSGGFAARAQGAGDRNANVGGEKK